jgi:hypothetical protein
MKARLLIEGSDLGPKALKIAYEAFDRGWARIASNYSTPGDVDVARIRLATIVLSLTPDSHDPTEIAAIAVQEMTRITSKTRQVTARSGLRCL